MSLPNSLILSEHTPAWIERSTCLTNEDTAGFAL
jgi:hypothetical protein